MRLRLSILPLRNDAQHEALEDRGYFTDMYEATEENWRPSQVALLLSRVDSEFSIDELGLVTRSSMRVATGWHRLRYERRATLEPIASAEIVESVPVHLRKTVERQLVRGGVLSPKASDSVVQALKLLRPNASRALEQLLNQQIAPLPLTGIAEQAAIQEADSVRLALDIAGGSRNELLGLGADGASSFVQQLSNLRASEDTTIAYDGSRFLDFDRIESPSGVVEFSLGDERLLVMNVNRQPLEKTTGADLIYFNQRSNSYVLVQYKTMREEGSDRTKFVYRPDAQLRKELRRMRRLNTASADDSIAGYRLGHECCFLKLCKPIAEVQTANLPVKGIYLPINYYDVLIRSPEVRGQRGGIALGYETISRRIANTLFVDLVRGGWVGSSGTTTELLTDLVEVGLSAGRSVTFAAKAAYDHAEFGGVDPVDNDIVF